MMGQSGRTDGQTLDSFIDTAAHTMRAVSINRVMRRVIANSCTHSIGLGLLQSYIYRVYYTVMFDYVPSVL